MISALSQGERFLFRPSAKAHSSVRDAFENLCGCILFGASGQLKRLDLLSAPFTFVRKEPHLAYVSQPNAASYISTVIHAKHKYVKVSQHFFYCRRQEVSFDEVHMVVSSNFVASVLFLVLLFEANMFSAVVAPSCVTSSGSLLYSRCILICPRFVSGLLEVCRRWCCVAITELSCKVLL